MRTFVGLLLMGWASFCFCLEDTLPRGAIQFRLEYSADDASSYYDRNQIELTLPVDTGNTDYEDYLVHLEFEYGIANDLTFVMETDYSSRELTGGGTPLENDGSHGLYLATRQRLSPAGAGFRIMAETGVYIPEGVESDDTLPLRSSGIDWVSVASYNQDFFPTRGGMEMDFGYVFRNEAPENEIFFNTKLWLGLAKVGRISFLFDVVESTSDNKETFATTAYSNSRGYQRVGAELSRSFGRSWRAGFSVHEIIDGRNVFGSGGWKVSITWRGRGR